MKSVKRPSFLQDIEDCADYLFSEAGEEVAQKWKQALHRTLKIISSHPKIGRLRQDLPIPGIRSFFIKRYTRYLIFYRFERNTIELLCVTQGMMHLPGLFEGT